MTKLHWRIYYADYSTFDSSQGEPWEAPAYNVIIINQRHEDSDERPYVQHMADYYVWLGYKWLACDRDRLWQYWFVDKYDFPRAAMLGFTAPNDDYNAIVRKAKDDKEFYG